MILMVNIWIKKKNKKKKNNKRNKNNSTRKAIQEYMKYDRLTSECDYCYENKKIPIQFMISLGIHAYLMLPKFPLCEGHCVIVPVEHSSSGCRSISEEVWEEMNIFMKSIVTMNRKLGNGTIFMETYLTNKPKHTIIECIPLHPDLCAQAKMYFKKALEEEGPRWSSNPRLIDTSEKGLRSSVPERFPYFYVQYGVTMGNVHTIENEKKFPIDFGIDIIGGMLGLDPSEYQTTQSRLSYPEEIEVQKKFLKNWMPYDWTTKLDEQIVQDEQIIQDEQMVPIIQDEQIQDEQI